MIVGHNNNANTNFTNYNYNYTFEFRLFFVNGVGIISTGKTVTANDFAGDVSNKENAFGEEHLYLIQDRFYTSYVGFLSAL